LEPSARLRTGIESAGDDSRDAALEHCFRAGRCVAPAAAWLERHVQRRAACRLTRRLEREDLRVRPTFALVPSLSHDLPVADDDCTDDRIRVRRSPPAFGELQRPLEHQASAWT